MVLVSLKDLFVLFRLKMLDKLSYQWDSEESNEEPEYSFDSLRKQCCQRAVELIPVFWIVKETRGN